MQLIKRRAYTARVGPKRRGIAVGLSLFVFMLSTAVVLSSVVSHMSSGPAYSSLPISTLKKVNNLNGAVFEQVIGNPQQIIPILRQEGVTGVVILLGGYDSANPSSQLVNEVNAYDQAGFLVNLEWNFQGGWGRLYDMNPYVYNYVQQHPSEGWASFEDTLVNLSSLPKPSQELPNGTLVVFLQHAEYYVYQFYSASNFTWLYNETSLILSRNYNSNIENGLPVPYGHYHVFYNSTGLYLAINTHYTPKIVYNLHWISFDNDAQGRVNWASLFFSDSFSAWQTAWTQFCQFWAGKIAVTQADNSGVPSYDANPAIIQYLENTYHFNFSFEGWGTPTQSNQLWLWEQYNLLKNFALMKLNIAHEYGILVETGTSDMSIGVNFMPTDIFASWPGSPIYESVFGIFYNAGWRSGMNFTRYVGIVDWEGSPPSTQTIADYFNMTILAAEEAQPTGALIELDWQFPTNQTTAQDISALNYWIQRFHAALYWGGYLSSIGAQRYSLGTVYLQGNYPFASGRPWGAGGPLFSTPLQIQAFDFGDLGKWMSISAFNQTGVSQCSPQGYFMDMSTGLWACGGLAIAQESVKALPFFASLIGKSSAFYVRNNFNTYVFQSGGLYYVLINPSYGGEVNGYTLGGVPIIEPPYVNFSYYHLPGYNAYDVASHTLIQNNTLIPSNGYIGTLVVLVPSGFQGTSLVWTSAWNFSAQNGSLYLANPPQGANLSALIVSSQPIASFVANTTLQIFSLLTNKNTTLIHSEQSNQLYFYYINLPTLNAVTIKAVQPTTTTSSNTQSSTSSPSTSATNITSSQSSTTTSTSSTTTTTSASTTTTQSSTTTSTSSTTTTITSTQTTSSSTQTSTTTQHTTSSTTTKDSKTTTTNTQASQGVTSPTSLVSSSTSTSSKQFMTQTTQTSVQSSDAYSVAPSSESSEFSGLQKIFGSSATEGTPLFGLLKKEAIPALIILVIVSLLVFMLKSSHVYYTLTKQR